MPRRALHLVALLLLLACAAFAFAACGGDDEPSKDEFVEQADDICKEGEDKIEDLDQPSDLEGFAQFADESVEIAEDTKGELEDLEVPSDVEDDWNDYLDNVDEGIELIQEAGDAAEAGDQERFNEIIQGDQQDQLEEENEEIAENVGLEQCGKSD